MLADANSLLVYNNAVPADDNSVTANNNSVPVSDNAVLINNNFMIPTPKVGLHGMFTFQWRKDFLACPS